MVAVCRVCFLGALLAAAGCAKPSAVVDDAGGVGGNGSDDLSSGEPQQDFSVAPRCGDGVCTADSGEACDTCPADCGACAGCPMGYADCNHNPADGCETPLNTPMNCGGCGTVCQQVGGTNACVASGNSYVCQPTCDATHADCNTMPNDGCEVDTTGPNNCGGCGKACTNPHGTTTCTTQGAGWFCNPTCTSGWGACGADKSGGCTTNTTTGDVNNCGACGRACSASGTSARACTNGLCTPTCAAPFSDCSDPAAPGADNGCETNGTADPGESDNACSGQSNTTSEGSTTTITTNRILPAGDLDTIHVHFSEGSHTCVPFTSQSYAASVTVSGQAGLLLSVDNNNETCDNTWKNYSSTGICVQWCGTCTSSDDTDWYFQVSGIAGANSCGDYTVTVTYASEGNTPPGCTKPSC